MRIVYFKGEGPPLLPAEVEGVLRGAEAEVFRAIRQVLDEELADAMVTVSDPAASPERRGHAAGAMDAALRLIDRVEQARKRPPAA